jgi:hypothetical protein
MNIYMYIYSGVLKPDITFFGEILPDCFFKAIKQDVERCDLVIVIGTFIHIYICDSYVVYVFVVFIHELKKVYIRIYNNDILCILFFQSDNTRRREMRLGYSYICCPCAYCVSYVYTCIINDINIHVYPHIYIGTSLKVGGSVHLLLKHIANHVPQVF